MAAGNSSTLSDDVPRDQGPLGWSGHGEPNWRLVRELGEDSRHVEVEVANVSAGRSPTVSWWMLACGCGCRIAQRSGGATLWPSGSRRSSTLAGSGENNRLRSFSTELA